MEPEQANKVEEAVHGRWKRLLLIVLFVIVFDITEVLVVLVTVVQFLLNLLAGRVNGRLQSFGHMLGAYAREIVAFLTYAEDRLPFPFSPWPSGGDEPGGND